TFLPIRTRRSSTKFANSNFSRRKREPQRPPGQTQWRLLNTLRIETAELMILRQYCAGRICTVALEGRAKAPRDYLKQKRHAKDGPLHISFATLIGLVDGLR